MSFIPKVFSAVLLSGLFLVAGCSGGSPSSGAGGSGPTPPIGTLAAGGASSLYVVQQTSSTSGSALVFGSGTNAAATPQFAYTNPSLSVQAVAVDGTGKVYVGVGTLGNNTSGQILIYPSANTNVVGSITGTAANPLGVPQSIAIDKSGQLYVLTEDGVVLVYAAGASGSLAPVRTIVGQATQIVTPLSLTVDTLGNIYIASATAATTGSILVFGTSANGNAAPSRVITSPNVFYGMAVDANQNLYAVLNTIGSVSTSIVEYASSATGAATPSKTITGSISGLSSTYGYGLALDAANNVWISTATPAGANPRSSPMIMGFGPQATGNSTVGAGVSSSSWTAAGTVLAVK